MSYEARCVYCGGVIGCYITVKSVDKLQLEIYCTKAELLSR